VERVGLLHNVGRNTDDHQNIERAERSDEGSNLESLEDATTEETLSGVNRDRMVVEKVSVVL
jgi:hypothetical protein